MSYLIVGTVWKTNQSISGQKKIIIPNSVVNVIIFYLSKEICKKNIMPHSMANTIFFYLLKEIFKYFF